MWLSLNMLKSLVDLEGITPEEISDQLTMSTAETEEIEYTNKHFNTIVTAKLLEADVLPDSDHLTLCKVDSGSEVYTVVCGAPNHKKGDIVALALPGTRFSEDFIIKKTKIRGQESNGMLCSARELGLSEDHSGIIIYPEDTKIGVPLSEIYKDWVDVRIEIDNKSITHRPDLWGHYGFARELAAIFKRELKDPVDASLTSTFGKEESFSVDIQIPELANRYCGLVVKNVKIGESPEWLKSRVTAIGMRPISNIVDITNYVMAEIGNPMHAFSLSKLRGNKIIVRHATEGETITTLDDQERKLLTSDIVISDPQGAVAIAGIMGGANSDIDEAADEIVLEAANFDAVSIRKTAQRLALRTDASMRFEKSLDPELCERALIRSYQLIKELCPEAEAVSPLIDCYPHKRETLTITIDCNYIRKILGTAVSDERIVEILTALEYGVIKDGTALTITVPSYRATKDIEIEADIIEEVGRIFQYDNIEPVAPLVPCAPPMDNDFRIFEREVKDILSRNCNLSEVYNYSFVGEELLKKAHCDSEKQLRLKNHLSVEHDRLRTDMIPGIVANIRENSKSMKSFGLYEFGRTYHKDERTSSELASEKFMIAGAIYSDSDDVIFYDAKNAVVTLLEKLKIKKYNFEIPKESASYVHPYRSLNLIIKKEHVGTIFELHPLIQSEFEISGHSALFYLDANALFAADKKVTSFTDLQKYPDVNFEISVVADKKEYSQNIIRAVRTKNNNLIKSVEVVSVYEGTPLPEDKKSVSLAITFAAKDHTLSGEEIEKLQNDAVKTIEDKGYALR